MNLIILNNVTCYEKSSLDVTSRGVVVGHIFKKSPIILIEKGFNDSMCLTTFGIVWISNSKIANYLKL